MKMLQEFVQYLMCAFLPELAKVYGIGYRVVPRITYHSFSQSEGKTGKKRLLAANPNRVDYKVYNLSGAIIGIADSDKAVSDEFFTARIAANTEYDPEQQTPNYKGEVTFNPVTASDGALLVTEYVLEEE